MVTIQSRSAHFSSIPSATASFNKWVHLRQEILTGLAGWLPKKPGILLRQLLYPGLFARMGDAVTVEWGCEFRGAHQIEIGSNIFLGRNVCLDAAVVKGRIQIGDACHLLDNVRLMSFNDHGKIVLHEGVDLDRGVDMKAHGGGIDVGSGTYIGPYVCLAGPGYIKIGKNCLIAAHSGIYGNNHIFSNPTIPIKEQGTTNEGITIEDDCWLGTGVKVMDGVTIGRGSVIGAGAVVTKDIPPYSIAVGVPAKVISQRGKQPVSAASLH